LVVIAVSGLPGAGTSTIARGLAKRLGIGYFSPGEVFKGRSKSKRQAEAALEVWLGGGKERSLHEYLDNLQVEKAREGDVVVCGKLSVYILRDLADFKVWVDCPLDERVRRSAKRDGTTLDEAREELVKRESIETMEWKRIYGMDRGKQKGMADLVIDTAGLSVDETVERILESHDL
jgi:cytidylate kinase